MLCYAGSLPTRLGGCFHRSPVSSSFGIVDFSPYDHVFRLLESGCNDSGHSSRTQAGRDTGFEGHDQEPYVCSSRHACRCGIAEDGARCVRSLRDAFSALFFILLFFKPLVSGKFRHLPVVENGEVIALLDIAKCLYDAVARMERAAEEGKAIAAAVEGVEKHWGTAVSGL
jgi:hypothetical protein